MSPCHVSPCLYRGLSGRYRLPLWEERETPLLDLSRQTVLLSDFPRCVTTSSSDSMKLHRLHEGWLEIDSMLLFIEKPEILAYVRAQRATAGDPRSVNAVFPGITGYHANLRYLP